VEQNWYVYILRCADGTLYTGITNHLERRLKAHNAGTASKYTRVRRPVTIEYNEKAESKGDALRRELQIKAMPRQQKEFLINANKQKSSG
jgi:predicted GIY-YIG superfamily endonuclease